MFEINTSNLNELFDNEKGVLVMAENPEIRNNRLNLLAVSYTHLTLPTKRIV